MSYELERQYGHGLTVISQILDEIGYDGLLELSIIAMRDMADRYDGSGWAVVADRFEYFRKNPRTPKEQELLDGILGREGGAARASTV